MVLLYRCVVAVREVALPRLFAGMGALVDDQVALMSRFEIAAREVAHVRLLASVSALVNDQVILHC